MRRFFQLGLLAHVALVVVIATGAYLGWLPSFDKLAHAVLIGGLGFFLDGVLAHRPLFRGWGSLAAALVMLAAGLEEYAQRFSKRRSVDLGDFIADVVGVVFFVWLSRRVDRPRAVSASSTACARR